MHVILTLLFFYWGGHIKPSFYFPNDTVTMTTPMESSWAENLVSNSIAKIIKCACNVTGAYSNCYSVSSCRSEYLNVGLMIKATYFKHKEGKMGVNFSTSLFIITVQ